VLKEKRRGQGRRTGLPTKQEVETKSRQMSKKKSEKWRGEGRRAGLPTKQEVETKSRQMSTSGSGVTFTRGRLPMRVHEELPKHDRE
jgi:hypothetical protein